ncbi:MAG TPA: DUF393 domain-containing protein [Gemmatimonadota bacterium]|nr:DUF393 domain-containing protein [Gemmatimonadota bacterium]
MKSWVLLYDGDCEFCRRQVNFLERHDTRGRIRAIPFQSANLESYAVTRRAAEEAMHLVSPDGAVWRGAEAARETLELLPRFEALAWLFRIPGAMFVAERVYQWIARRRHRFGCSSAACRRGAPDVAADAQDSKS